ncbi:unnamed protein product [Paramecium primaurelia]|uniref:Uncharacterized protein n=1 Tax=Paramecium primaurelia TaxID=5886 RepID=A0A8S1QDJ4_PARPR|nr:unnamed protein product [Paramecium primaurelia]
MISLENCYEHPNSQIGGIYKVKHNKNIQRKVCLECILKYKIPSEQILNKEEFVNCMLQKANQLNIKNILEVNQSKSFFKTIFQKFDLIYKDITLIFSNIRDIIKRISEQDTAGDEKFLRLINQNLNPFECSQTDLDFLVNFIEGNLFEEWIDKKKFVSSKIQKTGVLFEKLLQNANQVKQEESIIQLEGVEKINNQLMKTSFELITQKNGNKVYQKDGQILRIQKNILGQKSEQLLYNLEQIKHLEFQGQYGVNGYKINQWNYFWKGQQIGGGVYNSNGEKEGNWIDLCDNYWDQKNIIEKGYYEQNKKIGVWNIIWDNQEIGGGQYENGIKTGKWIVLSDEFKESFQVTYRGEYKNGYKVGSWDINYEGEDIGGGSYDENGVKIGKWIELIEGFKNYQNLTYNGEYINGNKIGQWDINYEGENIGGGLYDEDGGVKIGKWIDIGEGFEKESQITYISEYKNGKQIGRQNIWYKKNYGDFKNEQIGGGLYDDGGHGIKIGSWIEISDRFKGDSQVIFRGDYVNGKKIRKWEILFRDKSKDNFELIAGGQYDEENDDIKIGKWIEIDNRFASYSQIIQIGEYKDRKKIGRWDIMYRQDEKSSFQQIGGGKYNDDGIKIENWTEIGDRFWRDLQIITRGEYKKGKKTGKWEILYKGKGRENFEQIAGGSYDEVNYGIKIGKWKELDDGFNYNKQVIYDGEYKNGKKDSKWTEIDIKKNKSAIK